MQKNAIQVLIVEDNPADAELIRVRLAESARTEFRTEWVDLLSEGLDHLSRGGVDAVLLDLGLPDSDGLSTFDKVHSMHPQVPVIVLTGLDDEDASAEAVRRGAQDYLFKGHLDATLLARSIGYAIERNRAIVERKQAEEALRASEEKLKLYLEHSPDGIYILDSQGRFLYGNRAAEVMSGYTREELIGKDFLASNLLTDNQIPAAISNWKATIAGRTCEPVEYRLTRRDGTTVLAEIRTIPISHGDRTEILGIARDVTERRRMEQQLQLSGRLAAIGELAAGVAHEVNNPLTSVQAYAQLLSERDDLDEIAQKDIQTIYSEAQRAARITGKLLSFARRHKPDKTLISINDAIEKSVELHAYRMEASSVVVTTELDRALPRTRADYDQMLQVFINILANSEHAMTSARGGGNLVIKTEAASEAIRITIVDDGPGITQENLRCLFDPFFTTKGVGDGTGLGLSICYGIIQEHGGEISVQSEPGHGTTVVVDLPIRTEDDPGTIEVPVPQPRQALPHAM